MPRGKQNQPVMMDEGSKERILQDFSITSISDINTDVLGPSDSSLFESIVNYEVVQNVTLNQTDDLNLQPSDLYPADTTIMDMSHINSPNPLFKKPFNTRSKRKPRLSIFDKDLQDSENDTPEPKVRRPLQRKPKVVEPNEFDEVFDSLNENTSIGNINTNIITRRRNKKHIENSLFDKDLNSSESDVSMTAHRVRPRLKIIKKENVNPTEFDHIFDNSLNESVNDRSKSKRLPFKTLKSKLKNVETSMFDSDLNSSEASFHNSSKLETSGLKKGTSINSLNDKNVDEPNLSESVNKDCSHISNNRLPFKSLQGEQKQIESCLFDSDLNSSEASFDNSSKLETSGFKKGTSMNSLNDKNVDEPNLSESVNKDSSNISNHRLPFKSLQREQKQIESCLFDSDLNSSYSLQLSSSELNCDEDNGKSIDGVQEGNGQQHENKPSQSIHSSLYDETTLAHSLMEDGIIPAKEITLSDINNENVTEDNLSCKTNNDCMDNTLVADGENVNECSAEERTSDSLVEENSKDMDESEQGEPLEEDESSNVTILNEDSQPEEASNISYGNDMTESADKSPCFIKEVDINKEESFKDKTFTVGPVISLTNRSMDMANNATSDLAVAEEVLILAVSGNEQQYECLNKTGLVEHSNQECEQKKDNALQCLDMLETNCLEKEQTDKQNETKLIRQEEVEYDNLCEQPHLYESNTDLNSCTSVQTEKPKSMSNLMDNFSTPKNMELNETYNIMSNLQNLANNQNQQNVDNASELIPKSIIRRCTPSPELIVSETREPLAEISPVVSGLTNGKSSLRISIHKPGKISYEAADSSHPLLKKRRVSFLCDVDKGSEKRRSIRKSVVNDSNLTEQQSTSRLNVSQLGKSGFSLFIEQSSNSATSDSAYIDIYPSQNRSISSSVSAKFNSTHSNQPSTSSSTRESSSKSTTMDSCNTSENEPQQTEEEDEYVENVDESDEDKEITEKNSDNISITDLEAKDDEMEEEDQEEESGNITGDEMKDETEEETEHPYISGTVCTPRQQSLEVNANHSKTYFNSSQDLSNGIKQDCETSFKTPKKPKRTIRRQSRLLKPPRQPLNRTKVLEILENMPYSELKRKRKRSTVASNTKEQTLIKENQRETNKVHIVSKRLLKPARWITPNFYSFLTNKLKPRFGLKSRVQAENVVVSIVENVNRVLNTKDDFYNIVEEMKIELANFGIVHTHLDFHNLVGLFFNGDFKNKIYGFISEEVDGNPFEPDDLLESIL